MAKQGLALQSFSTELINCLENLRQKRDDLQVIIDLEEVEKAKLQAEIECLSNRLSSILTSLTKKMSARADFDRAISESEAALCRLLENSQTVVNNVRREMSVLGGDDIMKTAASGAALCMPVCEMEPLPCPAVLAPEPLPPSLPAVNAAVPCRMANGL